MAFLIPIISALVGLFAMLYAYVNIRQGATRVYTLEREAIIRRVLRAILVGTGLFALSIVLLLLQEPEAVAVEPAAPADSGEVVQPGIPLTATPDTITQTTDPAGNQIPSLETVTPTPTLDPNIPTATPTPVTIRAFVANTGGNGLTMRETPGGAEIVILAEDEIVTVLEEEGRREANGFFWVKVRTFLGDEGWVAEDFLEFEN